MTLKNGLTTQSTSNLRNETKTRCNKCKPNCSTCNVKSQDPIVMCKYVQPELRQSFRPNMCYTTPTGKMAGKTIYNESFVPTTLKKPPRVVQRGNLCLGTGKVSGDTVHKLTYQKVANAKLTLPFYPARCNLLGNGPLESLTTHKVDYVAKNLSKTQSCAPMHVLQNLEPLSDITTNRASYTPIDLSQVKTVTYRPQRSVSIEGKFDHNTINRLSFRPCEFQQMDRSWAKKEKYETPVLPMSDDTVYRNSYVPMDVTPTTSCKPISNLPNQNAKMENSSVYSSSYVPCNVDRTKNLRPKRSNLCLSDAKFATDTVNKMTYVKHENAARALSQRPCTKNFIEDGPMDSITIHQQDYVVPKVVEKRKSCRPAATINENCEPFSNETTNRLSYTAHDVSAAKVRPFKMFGCLATSTDEFEKYTVHKLSYLPIPAAERETIKRHQGTSDPHWFSNAQIDGNSVHALSYQYPGQYVPCSPEDPKGVPCPNYSQNKVACSCNCCGEYFIQEFVSDPHDGVTLLLELLRTIQLSQGSNNGNNTSVRIPPSMQRRALLDELTCLQCLLCCCIRYSESIRRLTASSAGLFTLAVCIMSNVNKSRIIALQLLTKACEPSGNGHSVVSEAMSTLRLRFGEPVRFRFLIGMLTSAGGQEELLSCGFKFINTLLDTAGTAQKRLYLQAELEQAGLDIDAIKKIVSIKSPCAELVFEELERWSKNHINIDGLVVRVKTVEKQNDFLKDKVKLLEKRIQILQEEKGVLMSLEQCLKERCTELQDEVASLKSSTQRHHIYIKKDESTPAEDEGISSSERSLTPEDRPNLYDHKKTEFDLKLLADEDETTIDDVIQELNNIVEGECEAIANKIQMRVSTNDAIFDSESEIVPANLQPQPPRRTKSLVHLYIPSEDYNYSKEIFFENETPYTSDEGSDSLLSASKYRLPRIEKDFSQFHGTKNLKKSESFHHRVSEKISRYNSVKVQVQNESTIQKMKSKSLDRIDDGLDAMVDIVLTNQTSVGARPQSDSGNLPLFINSKNFKISKLPSGGMDKQKMFFPAGNYEQHSYFSRHDANFQIKMSQSNAGLYSGFQVKQRTTSNTSRKSDVSLIKSRTQSFGKVTDLPSGLY